MRADTGYFPNQITPSKYAGACNFEKLSSLFIVSCNYKKPMTHSFFFNAVAEVVTLAYD